MGMLITPKQEFDLGGLASGVLSSRGVDILVANTKNGWVFSLDSSFTPKYQFLAREGLRVQTISNGGKLLAMTAPNELVITTLSGDRLYEKSTDIYWGSGIECCLFSTDDQVLWVIRHVEKGKVCLERRNCIDWQIRSSVIFDEPAPPTAFTLSLSPKYQILVLRAAAATKSNPEEDS